MLYEVITELYAASFKPEILEQAIQLNKRMLELFWDDKDGGFFLTPGDGESLIIRPKEIYDGALPSRITSYNVCYTKLLRTLNVCCRAVIQDG